MTLLGEIERNAPAVGDLGVLRFITAGSVDDGKSTLIGRLLHDTRAIFEDQLAAVARASNKRGQEDLDLSLLTDGLEAVESACQEALRDGPCGRDVILNLLARRHDVTPPAAVAVPAALIIWRLVNL